MFKVYIKKSTRVLSQKEIDSLLTAIRERNIIGKIIDKTAYYLRGLYIKLRHFNWSIVICFNKKEYVINLFKKDKELEKEYFDTNGKPKPILEKEEIDELLAAINYKDKEEQNNE